MGDRNYVVKKHGLYVAKPGQPRSYTSLRTNAQEYETMEEAKANCCGNEEVYYSCYHLDEDPVGLMPYPNKEMR